MRVLSIVTSGFGKRCLDVQICQCCEPGEFPTTTRAVLRKALLLSKVGCNSELTRPPGIWQKGGREYSETR